jgi:hypothetical protein
MMALSLTGLAHSLNDEWARARELSRLYQSPPIIFTILPHTHRTYYCIGCDGVCEGQ